MKYILHRRVHSSWQIAMACVGIFLGVVLAGITYLPLTASVGWLMAGISLVVFGVIKQRALLLPVALCGGLIVGLWRGTIQQAALQAYTPLYGKTLSLRGVVSDDIDVDKRGNTVLRLTSIKSASHTLPGSIWIVLASKSKAIERSDEVEIYGKLQRGFGTFAAASYRAKLLRVARPEPGDVALHIRDWFSNAVRHAIPEPESSLGVGYLVGQRRDLPEELDAALKTAGLTHIVVASGYNLTVLVRLARRLFERISKYQAALGSAGLIVCFVAVTGLSPSMTRAGLIASLSLFAWYYGRKFHPLVLLPFAVAVTVIINPTYAWGDIGWQLSFAAFAGVMILAPLLQAYYFGSKKPGTVRLILGETIAATLCTLPILLYSFGTISNVAIFANLAILPLVPLAMLLTFIGGLGALVWVGAAHIFGLPAYMLLSYMTTTAGWFAELPWATTELKINGWHVLVMYISLALFTLFMWYKTHLELQDSNLIE